MGYTFISGATGGIGKAFVIECAKKGDKLFLTGRSQDKLDALKKQIIEEYSVEVDCFACDLTSENERDALVLYAEQKGYKFKRIINVAGVDI